MSPIAPRALLAPLAGMLFVASVARAQDVAWTLTTADLKSEAVAVVAFDSAIGLKVTPAIAGPLGTPATGPAGPPPAAARDVPIDRFVDLTRPVRAANPNAAAAPPAAAGKFDLHLSGGDRLNGDPVGMRGESVVWRNPVVGEVVVPLTRLAGLTRAGGRPPAERRKDDVVTLTNGDAVRGTLADLSADRLTVKTDTGDAPVPFASLAAVSFAAVAPAGGGSARPKPTFRVRLDEGSTLAATTVKLAGDTVEATVGGSAKPIPLARVVGVEQVNGPVAFLSNLPPSANLYTPYLGSDQRFVARMNADFDSNPVRFGSRTYPRAIATHAYAKLAWPLDGSYAAFRTLYAMDDRAAQGGGGGDVTVRLKLDDKVVYEQANVRPGRLSAPVVVDLAGAKQLTLEVDFGRLMDSNDRLNWLEPALLKEKPAATGEEASPATAPAAK